LRHEARCSGLAGVSRKKEKVQLLLMLVIFVIVPSVPRLHVRWDDDTAAAPQPQPGKLEPSKVCRTTLRVSRTARHLDQRREPFRLTGSEKNERGVPNLNCMHPASVCRQVKALPCQPLQMLLELQESRCMEDVGLGRSRGINPR